MAFEADKHAKSRAASASSANRASGRTSGGGTSGRSGSLLFVGGFALGVVTTALVVLMMSPEMSTPELEETTSTHEAHGAQGALAAAQPPAAVQADRADQVDQGDQAQPTAAAQPTVAENAPQPTAAAEPAPTQEPQPVAAAAQALAASAPGTETTPSAATAAPEDTARAEAPAKTVAAPAAAKPAVAVAPAAAQARAVQPAAPALKPLPAAPATAPAKAEPPVDPNSQDAKLAAAAVVRQNAGTPIDSMLDQAFSPGAKGDKPAAAPTAATPPTPTRDDVIKAMSVLIPAIRGCAQGQSGMAPVSIVVQNDGRVESAALSSGPFQGTASGRCMEGVVRRARFPRFSQPSFRVQFPFAIQ